jgi:hypothetical protein
MWRRKHPPADARVVDERRAQAYAYGCLTCAHNCAPHDPDIDACELGQDWDETYGCPYWRWVEGG